MRPPRQTSRSLALAAVLSLVVGCSTTDAAFDEAADSGSSQSTSNGDGDGDGDGNTGTEDTDTGEDGEDDEGFGPETPELALGACDPVAPQVLAYDLEQAKVEAAPVLVRESVLFGDGTVPAIPLSPRPFLNHYDFDYQPAAEWAPEISGELWQPPMVNVEAAPRYRLQYAVRGPAMGAGDRLPVDLAVVVDLGPAMTGEPLILADEALAALESALIPGDRVSLIAAGAQPELLATVEIDAFGLNPLFGLIDPQQGGAMADVTGALELAYDTIAPAWENQGQQRVLLISNGHFELGDGLLDTVEDHAAQGRYLALLGVGDPQQYDGERLAALAHEGRGAMLFARDPDALWVELQQNFTAHMIAAATEVEITLTLPPGLGMRQREPHAPEPDDPKLAMLSPNDALIFHHELEACGDLDPDDVIRVELMWIDPIAGEARWAAWEKPVGELGEVSIAGTKGAATVAYVRALRSYRDDADPAGSYGSVLDAIAHVSDALEALPEDPDLLEMSAVLAQLSQ